MNTKPDTLKIKELIRGITEKLDNILLSCSQLGKKHTLTLDEYEFYYRGKKLTVFYKNTFYRYRTRVNGKKITIYLKESMWKRNIAEIHISQFDQITYEISCTTDVLSSLYDRLNEADVLLRLEIQHPDELLINRLNRTDKINFKTFNPFDINPK